jgi:flagellar hook-associated protein 3 FlgL
MRISTQVFFQRNVNSILGQQTELSQQNVHLSTQKRVIHGSDDAVAISTIQRLKQDLSVGEQYLKNGEMGNTANALEETSLNQVTNILQRTRELMVTAGNETYNAENREAIAKDLEGLREELIGVANTRDGNSQFIFSGFEVDTQPFQTNEFGTVKYHGDDGDRSYKVGSGVLVQGNDSGSDVFMKIAEGNGTFVSEGHENNNGSGVINTGSVIDKNAANGFLSEQYTVAITETAVGADPDYSVYGLKETNVTGSATINLASVDNSDPNFASFDPALYNSAASGITIGFVAIGPLLEVTVDGASATPAAMFDPTNTNQQTVSLNGLNFEIKGIPTITDTYSVNKYVEPTKYTEGQSIEFNGIKTELKGKVVNNDSFTLRPSEEKDIFATMKDAIDALRLPGVSDTASAQREMRFDIARLQIDNTMENVSGIVTSVGARMRTIESQRDSTLDFNLTNKKTLSNIEDLDMASAISDFKMQMSLLEVSQQTFVQMQSLSLFKLI